MGTWSSRANQQRDPRSLLLLVPAIPRCRNKRSTSNQTTCRQGIEVIAVRPNIISGIERTNKGANQPIPLLDRRSPRHCTCHRCQDQHHWDPPRFCTSSVPCQFDGQKPEITFGRKEWSMPWGTAPNPTVQGIDWQFEGDRLHPPIIQRVLDRANSCTPPPPGRPPNANPSNAQVGRTIPNHGCGGRRQWLKRPFQR